WCFCVLVNRAGGLALLFVGLNPAEFPGRRSLGGRACELGRIKANKQPVKPARQVHVGELLQIRTESGDFEVQVLLLGEVRGPASVAQRLYRETDLSRELRSEERRVGKEGRAVESVVASGE